METKRIRGIVIRENIAGDLDKYIVLFAKNVGKISVFVKGARNRKCKPFSSSALFTYGDFVITSTPKTNKLVSVDIIENFYNLRTSMEASIVSMYFVEFIDKLFVENLSDDDSLYLVLKGLKNLSISPARYREILIIFQAKFIQLQGYKPNEEIYLNSNLKSESLYTLEFIFNTDIKNVFKINVKQNLFQNIEEFLTVLINNNLDVRLKSFDMVKKIVLTN